MKNIIQKLHLHKFWEIIKILAPIGFILSIAFFVISTFNAKRSSESLVNNLLKIEQSLSTKHIGIFPDYLEKINDLLSRTEAGNSIIIFEDVLYYGAFYSPDEFKKMVNQLVGLSNTGHNITIAYYGLDTRMFREVVQESRINQQYLEKIPEARNAMLRDSLWMSDKNNRRRRFSVADSIASEKYFAQTRDDDFADFKKKVDDYLKPMYVAGDDELFLRIDNIRTEALKKPLEEITFYDFYNMYIKISNEIENSFQTLYNTRITMIPLNNYLVMSCWSNETELLFALPGKFAADEIGFVSHDTSLHNYVKTQLNGVIKQMKNKE